MGFFSTVTVAKTTFHVPRRYTFVKRMGAGAFGTVCCFKDERSGRKVDVRKAHDVTRDFYDASTVFREVKLMGYLQHDNIVQLLDLLPPSCIDFTDLYSVTEHMDADLHRVIYSKQPLTDAHFQYFMYQLLRGLKYLHSANVVHKRLRPGAILLNKNCDLKISDLSSAGPATTTSQSVQTVVQDAEQWPPVCQWYASPEGLLLEHTSQPSVDIWAVGCILGELLGRVPVFRGRDKCDQVRKIVSIMGSPQESAMEWLPAQHAARNFLQKLPVSPPQPWTELYPEASAGACSLMNGLLQFDPAARLDAARALEHEYFAELHDAEDEPAAAAGFPWSCLARSPCEPNEPSRMWRNRLYAECVSFREELLERDVAELEKSGIQSLLDHQEAEGWYWPKSRPVLQAHWRAISLVVLKSQDPGVLAVAAAMGEWCLRLAVLRFLLPAHLQPRAGLLGASPHAGAAAS